MTLSTAANRTFAFVPALLSVSVFVLSAVCPDAAWAGTSTGGQEHFADLYAMLKAWSTGTLGKSIALMFLLVGLGVGVIRGSIMGAVGCVAASMALFIGPQIIEQIFTALTNSSDRMARSSFGLPFSQGTNMESFILTNTFRADWMRRQSFCCGTLTWWRPALPDLPSASSLILF